MYPAFPANSSSYRKLFSKVNFSPIYLIIIHFGVHTCVDSFWLHNIAYSVFLLLIYWRHVLKMRMRTTAIEILFVLLPRTLIYTWWCPHTIQSNRIEIVFTKRKLYLTYVLKICAIKSKQIGFPTQHSVDDAKCIAQKWFNKIKQI